MNQHIGQTMTRTVRTKPYRCGGWASHDGPCGAPDCVSCHPEGEPEEEPERKPEDEPEVDRE